MTDQPTPQTEAGHIQRWTVVPDYDGCYEAHDEDGEYVLFTDHQAALAQARTEALDAVVAVLRYSEPLSRGTPEHDRWLYTEECIRAILAAKADR